VLSLLVADYKTRSGMGCLRYHVSKPGSAVRPCAHFHGNLDNLGVGAKFCHNARIGVLGDNNVCYDGLFRMHENRCSAETITI
jgi:hypothetical protein